LVEKGFSAVDTLEDAGEEASAEQRSKGTRPNETLGGVSREAPSMFSPSTRRKQKGLFQVPKAKRRFHKRPEGYRTSDEEMTKDDTPDATGSKENLQDIDAEHSDSEERGKDMEKEVGTTS
jgi:hypothetical protein